MRMAGLSWWCGDTGGLLTTPGCLGQTLLPWRQVSRACLGVGLVVGKCL